MRRAVLTSARVLLAVVLTLGAVAAWLRWRDPLAALPREAEEPSIVEERIERWQGRLLKHVVLDGTEVDASASW